MYVQKLATLVESYISREVEYPCSVVVALRSLCAPTTFRNEMFHEDPYTRTALKNSRTYLHFLPHFSINRIL